MLAIILWPIFAVKNDFWRLKWLIYKFLLFWLQKNCCISEHLFSKNFDPHSQKTALGKKNNNTFIKKKKEKKIESFHMQNSRNSIILRKKMLKSVYGMHIAKTRSLRTVVARTICHIFFRTFGHETNVRAVILGGSQRRENNKRVKCRTSRAFFGRSTESVGAFRKHATENTKKNHREESAHIANERCSSHFPWFMQSRIKNFFFFRLNWNVAFFYSINKFFDLIYDE